MQKKIFITGANGCIGHYVLDAIKENKEYLLYLLVRDPGKLKFDHKKFSNINIIQDDLSNIEKYRDILKDMDFLIHIAAGWGGREAFDVNYKYTLKFFELLDPAKCNKVIYFSTASILDKNNALLCEAGTIGTDYVKSKYQCYNSLRTLKIFEKITTVFPTLVFGGDKDHPYSHLATGINTAKKWIGIVRFLTFDAGFHYIHAKDIGLIVQYLIENRTEGSNFVLGNEYITLGEFIKRTALFFGKKVYFQINIPPAFFKFMAMVLRKKPSQWDLFCLENRHFRYNTTDASTFKIRSDRNTVETMLKSFPEVKINGGKVIPRMKIGMYQGVPTMFMDGKPKEGVSVWVNQKSDDIFYKHLAEIGFDLTLFTFGPHTWFLPTNNCWHEDGSFDFSPLDEMLERYSKLNPKTYFIPRLYLFPPQWWIDKNPDQLRMTDDGKAYICNDDEWYEKTKVPCISSPKWREDTKKFLTALVKHCGKSKFADRILGYTTSYENTEEWFYFGGANIDYNPCHLQAFKEWLKKKYKNNDTLRKAWNNENITFEAVTIPLTKERISPQAGDFFSPKTQMAIMDFYRFHHHQIADTIDYFANTVKKASDGKSLVLVFYGYSLQPIPRGQLESGHYALGEVLRSKNVDMLCSPTNYDGRVLGTGYSFFMAPLMSVKLNKKLWWDENDIRTHTDFPGNNGFGETKTLKDTIAMQWRQAGNEICNGTACWWMDQTGGWYEDPEFLPILKKMQEVTKKATHYDRSSVAEIAVILDEQSVFLRGNDARPLSSDDVVPLGHIGAPIDFLLLSDLEKAKPYKLYYFKYCYRLNKEILKMLEKTVKKNNSFAVWLDKPGIFDEDNNILDEKNIELMTGLKPGEERRTFKNWTSILIRNSQGSGWFRDVCREAGVHIYLDTDDIVYVNKSFVCINVNEGGKKQLLLPEPRDVYDITNDKKIVLEGKNLVLETEALSTTLLFLSDKPLK